MNNPSVFVLDFAFEGTGVAVMGYILGPNGLPIHEADITSIRHRVRDKMGLLITDVLINVADSIFDIPVTTDPRWDGGGTGYNFLHVVAGASIPDGNKLYVASYRFTPVVGEQFGEQVQIPTKPLELFA